MNILGNIRCLIKVIDKGISSRKHDRIKLPLAQMDLYLGNINSIEFTFMMMWSIVTPENLIISNEENVSFRLCQSDLRHFRSLDLRFQGYYPR